MSQEQETTILTVMNSHATGCGTPPRITDEHGDPYIGYFRSDCGDQFLFVYHSETGEATVRTGDAGWERVFPVKNGRAIELIMDYQERMWLRACWEAATAFSGHTRRLYPRPARTEGYRSACAELRAERGLSQADVARLADVSVRTLRRMERRALDDLGIVAGYSPSSAKAVAIVYGVGVGDLFVEGHPFDEAPPLPDNLMEEFSTALEQAATATDKLRIINEFGQRYPDLMADWLDNVTASFERMGMRSPLPEDRSELA